ncbi:MAG: ComF family protein [Clostridiales Family XIII bacterium]|jgi:ComF family protein|nr:ComF family protein [Clostridiales Family XIII bacterium]
MSVTAVALEMLFPAHIYCIACGNLIDRSDTYGLCEKCLASISWLTGESCRSCERNLSKAERDVQKPCAACMGEDYAFERAYFCCAYRDSVADMIRLMKYQDASYVGKMLGEMMAERFLEEADAHTGVLPEYDLLVPVPMHKIKKRKRGYNQAAVMAHEISGKLAVPLCEEGLVRQRETDVMSGLFREERLMNLEGAFSVPARSISQIQGKDILLIDDVFTTGSTAEACARALLDGGAQKVDLFAFAYA